MANTSTTPLGGTRSASDRAYDQIRRRLNLREILPGERLPSAAEYARLLDVSRPNVLQAFTRLQEDGRITVRPGRGGVHANSFEDSRSARWANLVSKGKDHREFAALMEVTEAGAVRRASRTGIPADVHQRLVGLITDLRGASDFDAVLQADNAFHILLGELSGAKTVSVLVGACRALVSAVLDLIEIPEIDREAHAREHEALLAAIVAGDASEAATLAANHVTPWVLALERAVASTDVPPAERGVA